MKQINLFVCENFKKEFEKVVEKINKNINIISFPSFCSYRDKNREEKFFKKETLNFDNSIIISGRFCEVLRKIPNEYKENIKYFKLDNCLYIFGKTKVDMYIKERGYIVTPGWLMNWKSNLEKSGFTREHAIKFYNEIFEKIVLLNTEVENNIEEKIIEFSKYVELPYIIDNIDLDYLELMVSSILREKELEIELIEKNEKIKGLNIEKSNYITALNILHNLSNEEDVENIIKNLLDKIKIFFSPKKFEFIYYKDKDILNGKDYEIISSNKGFIVKIKYGNEIFGYLKIEGFLFPQFFDSYLNFMMHINDIIGLSIANAKKMEKIKEMSITDELTGVYNRKYFELKLYEEMKKFKREKKEFSLIMFDLDKFKSINDKFGHDFGDKVLKTVVKAVRSRLRETDFFFQMGWRRIYYIIT